MLLFINWEIVSAFMPTSYANPFSPFIFLSNPVPGPTPGERRYAKSWWDLAFIGYYIVFWSMVRQSLVPVMKKMARSYGIKKPAKLDRFGEQGYAVIYFSFTGIWGVVSSLLHTLLSVVG